VEERRQCLRPRPKRKVRLSFFAGAFNVQPEGRFWAIDFYEGAALDQRAVTALVRAAVEFNVARGKAAWRHDLGSRPQRQSRLSTWSHAATSLGSPLTIQTYRISTRHLADSGPRWRRAHDTRIALAMLLEADTAMLAMLDRYALHHLQPAMNAHRAR
jgi:hypothetical protein